MVVDGVTDLFGLFGLSYDANQEVAEVFQTLLRPLADAGPAVVTVDHVTKSRDGRGRWAIGGQHKLAAVSGAAYTVDVVHPFGRGQRGVAKVWLSKDRPGHVAYHSVRQGKGRLAAELVVYDREGGVAVELHPGADAQERRDDLLLTSLSDFLQQNPGSTERQVLVGVRGGETELKAALALLVEEGWVERSELHGHTRYYSKLAYGSERRLL